MLQCTGQYIALAARFLCFVCALSVGLGFGFSALCVDYLSVGFEDSWAAATARGGRSCLGCAIPRRSTQWDLLFLLPCPAEELYR